ncbi:MAG: 3-dehydroquinate synthase, partial [Deltaproteobacteria bacterium]|nr:3-dehydroquinate synthase [Deltaproteobacteria bacterium]
DENISCNAGTKISEIFSSAGEKAFRFLEQDALKKIIRHGEECVVATGGGLPVDPINRSLMKAAGFVFYLQASFETLQARIPDAQGRPLWDNCARELFESRKNAYEDSDYIINTQCKSIEELARELEYTIRKLSMPIPVALADNPYPVYVGKGIFNDLPGIMHRHLNPEGLFVLCDENVKRMYSDHIQGVLGGVKHHIMLIPPGEESKTHAFLGCVLDEMLSRNVNHAWACLALGGGVTGDLSGFAASIFMRGIPVIQVPTTLLAQVDASIGGKTAINHIQGKNLVGTFHQPAFVLSDTAFLDTLHATHVKSALAEVIKYAVIMDENLFYYLEGRESYDYEDVVRMCCRDKSYVVAQDEKETGMRRILNFGHSLGHAIEKVQKFMIPHGQAVAIGMLFSTWLSHDIGMLKRSEMSRIFKLIKKSRIVPNEFQFPQSDKILDGLKVDKKAQTMAIDFVLTPAIGDATVRKLFISDVIGFYKRFVHEHQTGIS